MSCVYMHLHLSRLSAIKKNKVKGMEKGVCVCVFFSVMSPFQLPKFCHERLFFCCLCLCEFMGLEGIHFINRHFTEFEESVEGNACVQSSIFT